jgi:hypothetical protein
MALYDTQRRSSQSSLYVQDPKVHCLSYMAWTLWFLGYPDQALERMAVARRLAQQFPHSYSQVWVSIPSAALHPHRREGQLTLEQAEVALRLSTALGFQQLLTAGTMLRGWALADQCQEEGIVQIRQDIAARRSMEQRNCSRMVFLC